MSAQNPLLEQLEQQAMRDFAASAQDPQVALEEAQIEAAAGGTVSAGYDWGAQLGSVLTHPQGSYQYRRMRSLVMRELWQLLEECNLGAGFSDAFQVGRQLLTERLKQPSEQVQQQLLDAFDESMTADGPKEEISQETCEAIQAVIYAVLLEQDWEDISGAATTAVQQSFRQRISLPKTA